MKIRPLCAWYDLWVGIYWDRKGRRLYVLPVPCLGLVIDFGRSDRAPDCPICETKTRHESEMPGGRWSCSCTSFGKTYAREDWDRRCAILASKENQ